MENETPFTAGVLMVEMHNGEGKSTRCAVLGTSQPLKHRELVDWAKNTRVEAGRYAQKTKGVGTITVQKTQDEALQD